MRRCSRSCVAIPFSPCSQSLVGILYAFSNPLATILTRPAFAAFSLPWNVPKVPSGLSRQTKSFKAALALKRSLSRVEELFKEAFTLSYPSGSPQMVHEICHGLALLNMMRAHLAAAADDADPVELALTSTFYLGENCRVGAI